MAKDHYFATIAKIEDEAKQRDAEHDRQLAALRHQLNHRNAQRQQQV